MQTITLETNERYKHLEKGFIEKFGHATEYENGGNCTIQFFSAPGRSEIIGNHTDHNGGRVIAAAIDMDTIAAAAPNETDIIRITARDMNILKLTLNLSLIMLITIIQMQKYAIYTTAADRLLREYVRIL